MTATLLGTISTGKECSFDISAYDTSGKKLFMRLKRGSDAGKLPQGMQINQEGNIIGRLAFGNITAFDSDTTMFPDNDNLTVFDKTYTFWVEAYSNIGSISEIEIIEGGTGFTAIPTITITGGNGYSARAIAHTDGNTITSLTIEDGGIGYTSDPIITINGVGTGAILRGNIAGNIGISEYKQYSIKIDPISYKPWQNLYAVAQPKLIHRQNWRSFVSDFNIFSQDALYRKTDPNFGIQKTPRILIKGGLNPKYLSEYMDALDKYHYTKLIRFGKLKSARAYNNISGEQYEVIYYEIIENDIDLNLSTEYGHAPIYESNGYTQATPPVQTAQTGLNISDMTVFLNSFNNMRDHLKLTIGETVPEVTVVPDWMYDKQADETIIGYKPVVPLAYVKPGTAEMIKFHIIKSEFNPNSFLFQINKYEWDVNLSRSYDIAVNKYAASDITTFNFDSTTFDYGDIRFVDVVQELIGDGARTQFDLDHYVERSSELVIINPSISGELNGVIDPEESNINSPAPGITRANPAVITLFSAHTLTTGALIRIINLPGYGSVYDNANIPYDASGMNELNEKNFYVVVVNNTTLELYKDPLTTIPVDSRLFSRYTGGGTYVADSILFSPVKDYVAQDNTITFTTPLLLTNSVRIIYLKYGVQQYTRDNTGDKWLHFPKNNTLR